MAIHVNPNIPQNPRYNPYAYTASLGGLGQLINWGGGIIRGIKNKCYKTDRQ